MEQQANDRGAICSKFCSVSGGKESKGSEKAEEGDKSRPMYFSASELKFLRSVLRRKGTKTTHKRVCRGKESETERESGAERRNGSEQVGGSNGLSLSLSQVKPTALPPCVTELDYVNKLNDALERELHVASTWLCRFDEMHAAVGNRHGAQLLRPGAFAAKLQDAKECKPTKWPSLSTASTSVARWNAEVCRVKRTVKVQLQRTQESAERWTPREQAIVKVMLRRKPIPSHRRFHEALGGSRTEAEIERFISLLLATETRL